MRAYKPCPAFLAPLSHIEYQYFNGPTLGRRKGSGNPFGAMLKSRNFEETHYLASQLGTTGPSA